MTTDDEKKIVLVPQMMQELVKTRRAFDGRSEAEKGEHQHAWRAAIIPPSVATRNNRDPEVCFQCGRIGRTTS